MCRDRNNENKQLTKFEEYLPLFPCYLVLSALGQRDRRTDTLSSIFVSEAVDVVFTCVKC